MSVAPRTIMTRQEREEADQRWIDQHYLEDGQRYTFETNRILEDWGDWWPKYRWHAFIKQAECPWMSVAISPNFRMKWRAKRWARAYLKRGGPPKDWLKPRSDPNEVLFKAI